MIYNINKLANIYLKAAIRSKQFNIDIFKSIEDHKDILTYLYNTLQYLGAGSSRAVFILTSKKVIKVALNEAGKYQNEKEKEIYNKLSNTGLFTKVYDTDPNYTWIISELVNPINSDIEFEKIIGFPPHYIDYPTSALPGLVYYGHISEDGMKNLIKIKEILLDTDLAIGDLTRKDAWGKTSDGNLVILDSGFTSDIWNTFYRETVQNNIYSPSEAYDKAIKNGYSKELEIVVLKSPSFSYRFARDIPGANVEKLQEAVISEPKYLMEFITDVPKANKNYLYNKLIDLYPSEAYYFLLNHPEKAKDVINHPKWKKLIDSMIDDEPELKKALNN